MIQKSYSTERQDDVSVVDLGTGFTEIWLRRDHAQDTADDGPDVGPREFWSCDEVSFTVQGSMTAEEAEARFDELWAAHEYDGVPAEDIAKAAREEAAEAKEQASQAGGTDPQVATVAKLVASSIDFAAVSATDCAAIPDYIPDWEDCIGRTLTQNSPVKYGGKIYRTSQQVQVQEQYDPVTAGESQYYPIDVAPDGIIVYRTCHGAYDMVHRGEKRHYPDADGPVYTALEDTAYSPDAYPQHWEKAE